MTTNSVAVPEASTWKLDSYVDYRYLDGNLTGARLTQGIVWNSDTGEWITSWQYGLARMTEDFEFVQTTGSIDLSTFEISTGIPKVLADMGFDHIGDIDYYDGKLYISLDSEAGDYQNGHVAILNASDLSYTGQLYELVGDPTNEHDDVASWVAVDGKNGLGYGKEWQSGNTINIYNLDDWSFKDTLEMDQTLKNIQGAKVFDGKLYMSAHDSSKSVYTVDLDTGHVVKLFDLPHFDGAYNETEGISVRELADGSVEIMVELIVDPDGDEYADTYTRMFRYVVDKDGSGSDVTITHTWTVTTASDTTNADDMALTLREAIAKAAAGDTITFDASLAGQTITLEDAELALSKDITINGDIDGDGKSDITIEGGALTTVIRVTAGNATLDGLVVIHDEDVDGSSVVVDEGAALVFTNGATSNLETEGDDVLAGSNGIDILRGDDGDDIIQGLRGKDRLEGAGGDDLLIGGAGIDTMVGGNGDDVFIVSDLGDVVTELKGAGNDTVKVSFSYALADNVENMVLTGASDFDGQGNQLANIITGNNGANGLIGLGGNDTLNGGKGSDVLDGGTGADLIGGGAGLDELTGGAGADRFIFASGDMGASKAGADTILDMQGGAGDRIDLHLIDANEGKSGNQKFDFIGTGRFTGDAGELRYEKSDAGTYIFGDTDGDRKSDFILHLDDAMTLKDTYFLL